jgi:ligand-binding sensor domain-containing protein/signal transduction histidine kinase/DNA-binding response OmpR family regulator
MINKSGIRKFHLLHGWYDTMSIFKGATYTLKNQKHKNMKKILFLFINIVHVLSATASNALFFEKYQVENGLSHNSVWCVLQDSYDFMWFGTSDGLNFFDGKDFRIFRHNPEDITSLGNNYIQALHEDQNQNLWVGTNNGIYVFNRRKETFSFFDTRTEDGVIISSKVTKILKSESGFLWIATMGQGVFLYDSEKGELVQNSIYTSFVWDIIKVNDGNMLATSHHNGLICFDKNGQYIRSYLPQEKSNSFTNGEIKALFYKDDIVWFGMGTNSFYRLNIKNGQIDLIMPESDDLVISDIRSIFPFSNNQLWLGGNNGLYLFDISSEEFSRIDNISDPRGLSDQFVCDMERDREGGIWVSTYFGGVNYLPKHFNLFEHYRPLNRKGSILGKAISEFCEDEKGNIWIATEDGGLSYMDSTSNEIVNYFPQNNKNSISDYNIHALLLDKNKLWIGTSSQGIDVFDLKSKTFKNYKHQRDDSKSVCDNSINELLRDSKGEIYVGTTWGLCKYDRVTDSFVRVPEIGAMVHVFVMLEDSSGDLWVGSYNSGLFRYNSATQKWNHYLHKVGDSQSLVGNSVITLFEDFHKKLWIGTEDGGLCSFNDQKDTFEAFDPENIVLPNQVIYAIEQDEFENFWISCNAGLININPYTKKNRKVFTKADGLQRNQFNFHSSLHASDGKMYFGGINGFNIFSPKKFSENDFIPEVRIVDFRLFSNRINVTDKNSPLTSPIYMQRNMELKHDQNTFSLSFVALSYQAPEKNQYTYLMEGVDRNWNMAENGLNRAYYTSLPPGDYTFRVKGTNNDGVWNLEDTVLQIRILPPYWRTKWALIIYGLILMGAMVWFTLYRLRKIKIIQDVRIKAFQEKHERDGYVSKINFFTNLAHEIRTPVSLIKLPLERIILSGDGTQRTKGFLATIEKNTDYLLNLINQLLDLRKTEEVEFKLHIKQTNVSAKLKDIYERFHQPAEIKGINLKLVLPRKDLITGVDKEAFDKMVSNLLSNALKHAVSKVDLCLVVSDVLFEVQVSDDGKGIAENEKTKIFDTFYQSDDTEIGTGIGLAFTKVLSEKHGGTLSYKNSGYGGATFVIAIEKKEVDDAKELATEEKFITINPEFDAHRSDMSNIDLKGDSNITVLLVEDNLDLLRLTSDFMRDYYEILEATNGKEALKILEEKQVDLIVSDVMMPEMDGYELCKAIKMDDIFCHIPVILLTAKTNVESKIKGLEYGSDAYLEKPFSLEHLRTQVNNLLSSRNKLHELFSSSPFMPPMEIAQNNRDKRFINRLNKAIEERMSDPNFSIDTVCEEIVMSRSNFYRKIKDVSGLSPNDYMKMIRLKRAAELLLQEDYRIIEVCDKVGFSSSSYFAKCFKTNFGVLPREFILKKGNIEINND